MNTTLDDLISIREACDLSGFSIRTMYKYMANGTIAARQTKSGVWFTTRQEALRLKKRGKLRAGRKPKVLEEKNGRAPR